MIELEFSRTTFAGKRRVLDGKEVRFYLYFIL